MDQHQAAEVLRNLDLRTKRMEQLLPDLPTREQMQGAIRAAVAPLPTREEMHAAIQAAVAPLPTREEMQAAIEAAVTPLATKQELRELRAELRGHMDAWGESLRFEMRLYVEAAKAWNEQDLVRCEELKAEIRKLTGRVERTEAEIRADLERWIGTAKRSLPEILADIGRLQKAESRHHAESAKEIAKLKTRMAKTEARGRR